jgi:type I restriction enzyme, S subunit
MSVALSTLGEEATIIMGQSPPGESYNRDGKGVPLLNGPSEFGPVHPIEVQWTTSPTRFCQQGDVLFCVRGATAGRLNTADKEYCIGRGLAAIRGRTGKFDGGFLRYVLANGYSRFQSRGVGSTFINISAYELASFPVPALPLHEQRRIAEILDKAEALRAKRRAALAQLDTLTQSIFLDMFGDPATNPRKFQVAAMGSVCDVRDGTHDSPKYVSHAGFPLVTSKNVTGGTVDLAEVNYISEADYIQINKRSKVDRGDIILPMIGTIGSPVLVDHEPRYAIKNVALIKFVKGSPSATYVHHLLSGHYFDQIVSRQNRGGTQKFVSLGDLRSFPIPLPSCDEQEEFERKIAAVKQLRAAENESDRLLNDLFVTLQHRAFRGELER